MAKPYGTATEMAGGGSLRVVLRSANALCHSFPALHTAALLGHAGAGRKVGEGRRGRQWHELLLLEISTAHCLSMGIFFVCKIAHNSFRCM